MTFIIFLNIWNGPDRLSSFIHIVDNIVIYCYGALELCLLLVPLIYIRASLIPFNIQLVHTCKDNCFGG